LSSRSQIFEFKPLKDEDIKLLLLRALSDKERGLGNLNIDLSTDALEFIIARSNGDARRALNALELGVLSTMPGPDGVIHYDFLSRKNRSRKGAWATKTSTTTPSRHSSKACAAATDAALY
jgi:replication-associated recombination protein RarA